MAVDVNESGQDVPPPGIHHAGRPRVSGQRGHGPHLGDPAALDGDKAVGDGPVLHGVDHTVDNEHRLLLLFRDKMRPSPGFDGILSPSVVHCTCGTGRGMGLPHAVIPFSRANRPFGSFPFRGKEPLLLRRSAEKRALWLLSLAREKGTPPQALRQGGSKKGGASAPPSLISFPAGCPAFRSCAARTACCRSWP